MLTTLAYIGSAITTAQRTKFVPKVAFPTEEFLNLPQFWSLAPFLNSLLAMAAQSKYRGTYSNERVDGMGR